MVFKQAEEVWHYYKSTRLSIPPVEWVIWALSLVSSCLFFTGIWLPSYRVLMVGSGLLSVSAFLIWYIPKRVEAKKYALECATYRLNSSRDMRHVLQYVLFLRKLADQGYTHEHIAKLRQAVEIAEMPMRPAIQFNEHPLFWLLVIVPAIGGLWSLGTDFIKQADFWKGRQEAIATLSAFGVRILLSPERGQEAKTMLGPLAILSVGVCFILLLLLGFIIYQDVSSSLLSRKAQYQQLQRFLQWAEHDIGKSNSTGDDVCVRKCQDHMTLHIEPVTL